MEFDIDSYHRNAMWGLLSVIPGTIHRKVTEDNKNNHYQGIELLIAV